MSEKMKTILKVTLALVVAISLLTVYEGKRQENMLRDFLMENNAGQWEPRRIQTKVDDVVEEYHPEDRLGVDIPRDWDFIYVPTYIPEGFEMEVSSVSTRPDARGEEYPEFTVITARFARFIDRKREKEIRFIQSDDIFYNRTYEIAYSDTEDYYYADGEEYNILSWEIEGRTLFLEASLERSELEKIADGVSAME